MPRICRVSGVSDDDLCPKRTLLRQLKTKIEDLDRLRATPTVIPRLHVTAESCSCGKRKNPYEGKAIDRLELITLNGKPAYPQITFKDRLALWYPPTLHPNKAQHEYMSCYSGSEPPRKPCHQADCQYGIHLDAVSKKGKKNHECCYIECQGDKPGFKDWRPSHQCNYPNICKAECFDHFPSHDYFDMGPILKRTEN